MLSSDFRKEARIKLEGKWGKVALISLAYAVTILIFNFIQGLFSTASSAQSSMSIIYLIISILFAIVEVPLLYGLTGLFVKIFNGEDVNSFDFINLGFSNFKRSWGVIWHTFVKMLLPVLLLIFSIILLSTSAFGTLVASKMSSTSTFEGFSLITLVAFILYFIAIIWVITKSYYYQIAAIVAFDNPEITSKEAVEKSEQLMKNNRGKLFILELSFIGWAFLSAFTLGIGTLWLVPYIQVAIIAFYKFRVNATTPNNNNEKIEEDSAIKNN